MQESASQQRQTSSGIWMLLGAGAIGSLALLLWPFLLSLSTAAVIAVLVYPAYEWCAERTHRPSLVSLLMTLGVIVLVFVPGVLLVIALFSSLESSFNEGASLIAGDAWMKLISSETVQKAAGLLGLEAGAIPAQLSLKLQEQAGPIAGQSLRLVSGFGAGLIDLGIIIFSLFFLLRDGPAFVERLVWLGPLDRERTQSLMSNGRDAIFATVYGNIGVAVAQGVLGGVAFALAGIPSATFWGVVMAFMSMAPLIGAAVVWAPAGIMLLVQGEVLEGVLLLAFGAGVISTVDNFLRALIVGGRTELHPLAVFLSVLGGLALFGAAGVFLGPVLFVVSVSMIEMTRTALDAEAPAGGLLTRDEVGG